MSIKELLELRESELDTDYDIEIFLGAVLNRIRGEMLDKSVGVLGEYSFMGSEWQAVNKTSLALIGVLNTDK